MDALPKRKPLRLPDYDYSSVGSYFVTICTEGRCPVFWTKTQIISLSDIPLSPEGMLVKKELDNFSNIYPSLTMDTYCIMPEHIHMIISIHCDQCGQPQASPTLSRAIKQFKGSLTKKIGRSVWQRSYMERIIRNEEGYRQVWQYIERNPAKYLDPI